MSEHDNSLLTQHKTTKACTICQVLTVNTLFWWPILKYSTKINHFQPERSLKLEIVLVEVAEHQLKQICQTYGPTIDSSSYVTYAVLATVGIS